MKFFKFKPRKMYQNDKVLLALSVLLATIFWGIITFIVDPNDVKVISDIDVIINLHGSATQRLGLVLVDREEQRLQVTVSGKRTVLSKLTKNDITAIAQLTNVTEPGRHDLPIDIRKTNANANFEIESASFSIISATFDYTSTKIIPIDVDTTGTTAADGYFLGIPLVSDGVVEITGPESTVSKVSSAVIRVPANTDLTQTYVHQGDIILLDYEKNPIENSKLTLSVYSSNVTIPVLKQKNLPIIVDFRNAPADYLTNPLSYVVTPPYITLAGPQDTMNSWEAFVAGTIDFTQLDENKDTFDFKVSLSTGFYNIDEVSSIKVKLNMSNFTSKTFTLTSFEAIDAQPGQTVTFTTTRLTNVKVVGPKNVIRNLKASDIIAQVDVSDSTTAGQYELPAVIKVKGRNDCWGYGNYTVITNIDY